MNLRGTRRGRAVALLLILVVIGGAGVFAYRRIRSLYDNLGPLIVAQLQATLGRPVTIAKVDVRTPGRVVLEDVGIARTDDITQGVVARTRRVVILYDLWHFLRSGFDPAGSVSEIRVEAPWTALERYANGRWNVQDLFPKRKEAKPHRFRGRVTIADGTMILIDHRAKVTPLPAVNRAEGINGWIDFAAFPKTSMGVGARIEGARGGPVRASGYVDTAQARWLAAANLANLDAAYWSRYLFTSPLFQITAGRSDAELSIWREGQRDARVHSTILLAGRDLTIVSPRLAAPARGVTGTAQIDSTGISLRGRGHLGGAPVTLEGRMLGLQNPILSFQVSSPSLTLAALRQAIPRIPVPKGVSAITPAQVNARVFGPAADIVAEGTASLAGARVLGQPLRQVSLDWRYHGGVVTLTGARATGAAAIQADAWMDMRARPARLYAEGTIDGIRLQEWLRSSKVRLGGEAKAQFHVVGTPDALRGEASVSVAPLRINNARYARASARVRLRDGTLIVHDAVIADPAGSATAAGLILPGGRLAMTVRATSLRLGPLLKPYTQEPVQGTAYFWGQLAGTTSQPQLTGNLQVYAGRVGRYRVDFAEGPILVTPERVASERLMARLYPTSLVLRGEVRNLRGPSPTLDVGVELEDLSIGQVLIAAGSEQPVSGTVDASVHIGGTPAHPTLAGFVHVAEASVRGYDLGTVSAQVQVAQNRLQLTEISAGAQGMKIEGSASVGLVAGGGPAPSGRRSVTVAKNSPVSGTLTMRELNLSLLNAEVAPAATLGGEADEVKLTVSGTVGHPRAELDLGTDRLTVNAVPLQDLRAAVRWAEGWLTVSEASVKVEESAGTGAVRVASASWPLALQRGGALMEQAPGEAVFEVEQISLPAFTRLLRNSPILGTKEGQGLLNALQRVPASISGQLSGQVELTQVPPPSGGAPAGAATRTRVSVTAQVPELVLPSIAVEQGTPVTPAASGAPGAGAPTESLRVAAKLRAEYESGVLNLTEFEVSRDETKVTAQGEVVLKGGQAPKDPEPVAAGRLELKVDAIRVPLRAVGPFFPTLYRELYPLDGVGVLYVNVSGSLDAPRIEASADVENPVIAGLPFTQLNFPFLQVGGGQILIQGARLTRRVGETEHPVTLDGRLPFRWNPLGIPEEGERDLRVQLARQNLSILQDFAKIENPRSDLARIARSFGQLRDVQGDMEAQVTLAGTAREPQNSGEFRLYDVGFGLPSVASRVRDLQVRLVFAGSKVTVQQFEGKSSSGGSFKVGGAVNLGQTPAAGSTRGPLDLTVKLDGLQVEGRNLSRYMNERFSGTLRTVARNRTEIPAELEITGEFKEPVIRGTIAMRDASLILPAAIPEPTGEKQKPVVDPRFDLVFVIERESWIRNPSLRAQVAGRLPLTGTLSAPSVRGTLLVERGTLTFPTARFRISGEIDIAYAPATPVAAGALPREQVAPFTVDLIATTTVRGRDPATGSSRRYEITMTAQGPLSGASRVGGGREYGRPGALQGTQFGQLNIQATSEPPLPPSQILGLIGRQEAVEEIFAGGGNIQDVLRTEFEQALTASVVPSLFLPFETAVEEALGLEEFGLDFAFREPLQVRFGKRLVNNFYATYARWLTAQEDRYSFDIYYRISDRLKFGYRIEEPIRRRQLFLNGTFRF
jgi:hypothetical protein